ncbi:hypothetical protein MTO96_027113 [Rhipicephalus appendiculatus]
MRCRLFKMTVNRCLAVTPKTRGHQLVVASRCGANAREVSLFAAADDNVVPAVQDVGDRLPQRKRTVQIHLEPHLVSSEATEKQASSVCDALREVSATERKFGSTYVVNLRHSNSYLLGQIRNADQMPLYFDMPGTTTVEKKGAKQVRVLTSGHEKPE